MSTQPEAARAQPTTDGAKPATAAARPRLYFVNAPVDFLFIGGASLITFLLLYKYHDGSRTSAVIEWGQRLMWIVNWPHFSATSYRLYTSRANIRQYPMTAIAVPMFVVAAAWASLSSPTMIAPAFVHLFLLWSPYHFSGQSVGISLIYARRAGFKIGRLERLALSGFIFGTFVLQTARAEGTGNHGSFWAVNYPTLGVPTPFVEAATVGLYVCGAAFLLLVVVWCIRQRRFLPPIVLVPAVSQYVWFVLGSRRMSFNEFVPFFHSLQYLLIAWSMQLKEKMDMKGMKPGPRYVISESARWGILNFLGGATLFWVIPHALEKAGTPLPVAQAVVLSAVQIHHFFVDGVIWKLKNPKVASPLMANIRDMLAPRPAVASVAAS